MSASADVSRMIAGLKKAEQAKLAAAARGVTKAAVKISGLAQAITPVDAGPLAASATWSEAKIEDKTIVAEVGFNTDYAAAVHERLDVHHEQGQAKYLEQPLMKEGPRILPLAVSQEMSQVED